jgi:hypothetical protein
MNKGRTKGRKRPIGAISGFGPLQRPADPHCAEPVERVFKKTRRKMKGKRRTAPST